MKIKQLPLSVLTFLVLINTVLAQEKKVVFIIVDGIAFNMLQKANTPNLDNISNQGSFTEAYVGGLVGTYSETPTISAVGYNSLLTGTWVNKHNVYGNGIKNPNYNYPTIFRLFENQFPDKQTAIFSTWLDNRTKLIGDSLPQTNYIKLDYAYDGFELDTIAYPHDDARKYIKDIDKKVAHEAARYIKEKGPDLSWVYLEFSDDIGHKYGDSPQLYNAIEFEDKLIGSIWNSIKEREASHDEEWMLLVTTDHGRTVKDGKHHGGQTDRERSTWIVTNIKNTNQYFNNETPGIVDILPTMIDFLDINVDKDIQYEIDGVSLINPVNAINLKANIHDGKLEVSWKNINQNNSEGKLYIAETNNFNTGGKDQYRLLGTVNLSKEHYTKKLGKNDSKFYKIVLETNNNSINTWIIK
ncbi:alkaline phosphatase family protein [Galbibacter pacificus]|uniref:Alkaline phosphatase family protein n=1 Tax=Galbibacter pacificus TaxID=2996052 RepID=A0ABT6FW13_9FLAO|nr:alkaline phosphatase family protein [Galbibacter pacificus]MDG3584106.1 alkaline phosphatase family protein [Galbibacter pacificus]MDG3587461.1 alkaline phosphatase family protein [Galbibacter pacificus]